MQMGDVRASESGDKNGERRRNAGLAGVFVCRCPGDVSLDPKVTSCHILIWPECVHL